MDGMNTAKQHGIRQNVRPGTRAKAQTTVLQVDLDVQHFRRRAQSKPHTKAGQVRQMWPEIRNALHAGHRLKDIRTWLSEIGIDIGYARLSDYVGQLKRREAVPLPPSATQEAPRQVVSKSEPTRSHGNVRRAGCDLVARLQEHERKQALFDFNPEPDARKLIGSKEE